MTDEDIRLSRANTASLLIRGWGIGSNVRDHLPDNLAFLANEVFVLRMLSERDLHTLRLVELSNNEFCYPEIEKSQVKPIFGQRALVGNPIVALCSKALRQNLSWNVIRHAVIFRHRFRECAINISPHQLLNLLSRRSGMRPKRCFQDRLYFRWVLVVES